MRKLLSYFDLQMFANPNTQTTGTETLSAENKTYYSKYLIKYAKPALVHDQFGQKHPIPKNGGKTIEFRKFSPLPKLTVPLQEGVTPDGQSLDVSTITSTVKQYGGYVTYSDMLDMTAIDNVALEATEMIGNQAGVSLDTITRDVLNGGTNVIFAGGASSREALTENSKLTVADIKKAVLVLKQQNAPKIDGSYVAIIHPNVASDLTDDPEWKAPHQYVDTENIYAGEIGRIHGVRFVETTEAKIFEGGVFSTLVLGKNAYGVTGIEGGGLEHIMKQLGSGGTSDPLNQRATIGWKGTKTAVRLVETYMVRIESKASTSGTAN